MMGNRRIWNTATGVLLLVTTGGLLGGCDPTGSDYFTYLPSDERLIRDFLREQNILRSTDRETVLALIDWSRLNLVHSTAEQSAEQTENVPAMADLIQEGREKGSITVMGCWGTAAFLEKALGAVGIRSIYDTVNISNKVHARIDFPLLGMTSLHADNLHKWTPAEGETPIPPIEILDPIPSPWPKDIWPRERAKRDELIRKYLPLIMVYLRTFRYGTYYTSEQQAQDLDGSKAIGDVSTDPEILRMIDAEIDRLGGPEQAAKKLGTVLRNPYQNQKLRPASP